MQISIAAQSAAVAAKPNVVVFCCCCFCFCFVCPSLHHPHRPKVGAFTQIPRQPPRVPFCLPMHSPTPTDKKSGPPPGSVQSAGYLSARPLTHSHRPKVRVSTRIPSTSMVPFCRPLTYSHRPKVRVSTRISSTQRVPFLRLSTAEPNYAVLDRRKRYIFKTRKQRANKKQDTTRAQVLLSIVSI